MTEITESKRIRRPYDKPRLEKVRLVLEETILQTCKTGGIQGPDGKKNCNPIKECMKSQRS